MSVHTIEEQEMLYGLMAEFETPGELVAAARRTREAGFRKFDAYAPYPIHELDGAMDLHDNRVSLATLIGGLFGCVGGFSLCAWCSSVALPLNIAGRPLVSVPMFIPITFECTILIGGLTAAISMILMNGLPQPYHPVFNVERFANAARNKFFLCIEAEDPNFDREMTAGFLESLGPEEIAEVPR
ncbi:MAG TPA: DUF3341 domain-containing protein [Bryobacteraceae bacterium]|jgi:hypothetical protein|nr:DUF3341 domain-containing protein [Bryobacteraceae bacterium]